MSAGMFLYTVTISAPVELVVLIFCVLAGPLTISFSECHVCTRVAPHIGVHSKLTINEPVVLIKVIVFNGKTQEYCPSNVFDRSS